MYTTSLAKTTCKAEQRRLLAKGPPINVSDPKALLCPDGGEVHSLWYMSDGSERSAKLEGSFEGEVIDSFLCTGASTIVLSNSYGCPIM